MSNITTRITNLGPRRFISYLPPNGKFVAHNEVVIVDGELGTMLALSQADLSEAMNDDEIGGLISVIIDIGSRALSNVGDPVNSSDVATKYYVDHSGGGGGIVPDGVTVDTGASGGKLRVKPGVYDAAGAASAAQAAAVAAAVAAAATDATTKANAAQTAAEAYADTHGGTPDNVTIDKGGAGSTLRVIASYINGLIATAITALGLVPYSGATSDLDLTGHNLTVSSITTTNTINANGASGIDINASGTITGQHIAGDGSLLTNVSASACSGAVADGTYTMGIGSATNGTITIVNGIITAITQAS